MSRTQVQRCPRIRSLSTVREDATSRKLSKSVGKWMMSRCLCASFKRQPFLWADTAPCPNPLLSLWSNKAGLNPLFSLLHWLSYLLFSIEFLKYVTPWPTNIDDFVWAHIDYIEKCMCFPKRVHHTLGPRLAVLFYPCQICSLVPTCELSPACF